jgi:hypothetical protein
VSVLTLLSADSTLRRVPLNDGDRTRRPAKPLGSRLAYAAAHVIPRVTANNVPGAPADLDWDATLAFRHHLWSWGLGVADAMDTAQRNMGLDPIAIRELIARSAREAASVGGALVVGVNTDEISDDVVSLDTIIDAYVAQLQFAEEHGAGVVLMASRHLARAATGPADYVRVYTEVIGKATNPVVLHWLGDAFDATLAGYFGSADVAVATGTVLEIMQRSGPAVSGIKMSLLNADAEISVRAQLPPGVTMFTGDDFNYVELIAGDGDQHSDALLGAFAAIAPLASTALQLLDADDRDGYRSVLGPTETLSRQIFATPTQYYKTGVAFLSWLNGHQPAFQMVGGLHSARALPHLSRIVELANNAAAFENPELAAVRWSALLDVNGVEV